MLRVDIAFDRFKLERSVGRGHEGGEVYFARDLHTGDTVALKLYERLAYYTGEKLQREAAIVQEIGHPGVVQYLSFGSESIRHFIAMEWLSGETLEARLKRAPLSLRQAVEVAALAAEALGALHARGLIHRALGLRNIFLMGSEAETPTPKLSDIGFEVIDGRRDSSFRPIPADLIRFMPREQIRGEDLDARADVFTLGGILFRCVAGRDPYPGDDAGEVMNRINACAPIPRLDELKPETPRALSDLVARMLEWKDRRPPDGAAVAAELSPILGQLA